MLYCHLDKIHLSQAQDKMKHLFDRRAEVSTFQTHQLMVLLPIVVSPFQARFVGSYSVVHHVSDFNYFETPDQKKKTV